MLRLETNTMETFVSDYSKREPIIIIKYANEKIALQRVRNMQNHPVNPTRVDNVLYVPCRSLV